MESCEHELGMRNSVFTYSMYTEIWCLFNAKLTLLTECCFFLGYFSYLSFHLVHSNCFHIDTVAYLDDENNNWIWLRFAKISYDTNIHKTFHVWYSLRKFGLTFFLETFLIHRTLGCTHRCSIEQNMFCCFYFLFMKENTWKSILNSFSNGSTNDDGYSIKDE